LPAGGGALSAAEDDLEHESAAAGVVVRWPGAGGVRRGGAAAGWRASGDAVRPGWAGKTRLAIESAAELVPEFRNGVFWVGLAALRDPGLVAETVAQTLGARDGLGEHVGERELLLLLDNFEQVVEAAPELGSLLESCPNLRLLVTSRELLRIRGEVDYPVPPLQQPEAVDLFCARSQLQRSDDIADLCRRLDDLPLA